MSAISPPAEPYIDLFAAETAASLTFIYAILGEPLAAVCPEILTRIEYEIERHILIPYLAHRDYWWMGYKRKANNWNPWIISNLLPSFFTFVHDQTRLSSAVEKMMTELQHYVDAMPDDGGCDEGAAYWGVAGLSLFACIYQLKCASCGAIDLTGDEKARRIMGYVAFAYIADGKFINFADAAFNGSGPLSELIYLCGREMGLERLVGLAGALYHPTDTVTVGADKLRRMLLTLTLSAEMHHLPPRSGSRTSNACPSLKLRHCGGVR